MNEINVVAISGHATTDAELQLLPSGSRVVHYTITVRVEEPRPRVDVIPAYRWLENGEEPFLPNRGDGVAVIGAIQRRFFESPDGRKSRLEVIAERVGPANGETVLELILGGLEDK